MQLRWSGAYAGSWRLFDSHPEPSRDTFPVTRLFYLDCDLDTLLIRIGVIDWCNRELPVLVPVRVIERRGHRRNRHGLRIRVGDGDVDLLQWHCIEFQLVDHGRRAVPLCQQVLLRELLADSRKLVQVIDVDPYVAIDDRCPWVFDTPRLETDCF